jgi:PKD repeat protein
MPDDRGNLSVDFLAGMTIFMLALIWVATMIPGILIGVQSRTIDVDAVAYRTGVILLEDPGMPVSPPWENKNDYQKNEIERFGLAASKDTPNILKMAKIERFFCSTSFAYPADYRNRLIFGDRPYGFNITLSTFDGLLTRSVGDPRPDGYGYIRRLVKVKYPSNTTVDAQQLRNWENVTQHVFSFQLNNTELIGGQQNFAYQINPRRDQILINLTNLSGARVYTTATNRIALTSISIYRRNPTPPYRFTLVTSYGNDDPKFQTYIDGSGITATLPSLVNDNVSVLFSPGFFYGMTDDYSTLKISYSFNLTDPDNFFNNSYTSPYSYNYSPAHVTQPRLKEGLVEIATWAAPFGAYAPSLVTATPTPVQPPVADFYGTPRTGTRPLLVAFTDMSTGVPTTWNWTFGDIGAGNTSTLQNPTHTYTSVGAYSVNLTVTNIYGSNTLIKTNYITVGLRIPVPDFTANTTSGTVPLPVSFTDTSTNSPTIWAWRFGDIGAGNTSALQNPSHTYTQTGRYTVNLTASTGDGNATLIKTNYITVNPSTPWNCTGGWNYRKNITTIRDKVSGSHTNFPLLVNLASDADLAARARSDGYDIYFTDSDGTTKLPHEIEKYTSSTGALVAWVKVPTLSNSANTTIFMYYGCTTASDQQDKNNVWDTGFKGVWHLNQSTGVTAADSTSNANSATPVDNPAASTGQIGGALTFASPDRLIIAAAPSLDLTTYSNWTMSAWVKPTSYAGTKWPTIYTYGDYRASMGLSQDTGTDGRIEHWLNYTYVRLSTNSVTLNAWNYVTISRTAAATSFYLNGIADGSTTSGPVTTGGQASTIGNFATRVVDEAFKGLIDEVRLSASNTPGGARSSDWIKTEYNNQNSPSTFYSVSSEESWTCEEATPTPTPTATATATPTATPTPVPLAYVQGTSVQRTGTTAQITFPSATTTGHFIVVSFVTEPTTLSVSSVADTTGNSYSLAIGGTTVETWGKLYTYYASNINGGSTTITVSYSGSATYNILFAAEYAGVKAASPLDKTSAANGNSAALASGSQTTTQASELIFGFGASDSTATASGSNTQRVTRDGQYISDRFVSSIGTYQTTGTNSPSDHWALQMATFKGA